MLMFNNSKENDNKGKGIEEFIRDFRDFKNKRKIVELDLEKRIISQEEKLDGITDSIDIIKDISENGTLEHIKKASNTMQKLEDLSITDRLEIIQNRENINEFSERIAIFNKKMDLMANALKIFDKKIKEGYGETSSCESKDSSDMITVLDEISSIKKAISDFRKMQPIGKKEQEDMEKQFDSLRSDFAKLVHSVREELESYDKKTDHTTTKTIESSDKVKIDNDGKKLFNYDIKDKKEIITLIGKLKEVVKTIEEKDRLDEKSIELNFQSKIDQLREEIVSIRSELKKKEKDLSNSQERKSKDTTHNEELREDISKIDRKIESLEKSITSINSEMENEAKETNKKLSDAMDAIDEKISKYSKDKSIGEEISKENDNISKAKKRIDSLESSIKEHKEDDDKRYEDIRKTLKESLQKVNGIDKALERQIENIRKENNESITEHSKSIEDRLEERLKSLIDDNKAQSNNQIDYEDIKKQIEPQNARINKIEERLSSQIIGLKDNEIDPMNQKIETISNSFQNMKSRLDSNRDIDKKRYEDIRKTLKVSLEKVSGIENNISRQIDLIKKENLSKLEKNADMIAERTDRKIEGFIEEHKRRTNAMTPEEIEGLIKKESNKINNIEKDIRDEINSLRAEFKDSMTRSNQNIYAQIKSLKERETKDESGNKDLTKLQARINEVMRKKIDGLEHRLSDISTGIHNQNNTENEINLLKLRIEEIVKENSELSETIRRLHEQLNQVVQEKHTRQSAPIILE